MQAMTRKSDDTHQLQDTDLFGEASNVWCGHTGGDSGVMKQLACKLVSDSPDNTADDAPCFERLAMRLPVLLRLLECVRRKATSLASAERPASLHFGRSEMEMEAKRVVGAEITAAAREMWGDIQNT